VPLDARQILVLQQLSLPSPAAKVQQQQHAQIGISRQLAFLAVLAPWSPTFVLRFRQT
jgi:hypothetical protein